MCVMKIEEVLCRVEMLNIQKKYIFALMLTERQAKVYFKACINRNWNRKKEIINVLEKCWSSIVNDKILPVELVDLCQEYNPENIGSDWDDIHSFCITVLNNVTILVQMIVDKDFDNLFARCNYDFLESFLYQYYGWEPLNTEMLVKNDLMQLEYKRNIRDLSLLESNIDFKNIYTEYHMRSEENLLDNYWFNDNFESIDTDD